MCLDDVFVPSLPHAEYSRGHMSQPLPPSIITLVLKGANGSFDAIMEKFGWLLSWTSPRDTYSCVILLQKFDMLLRPNSQTSPLHQECRRSFVRSQSFSEGLLRVLHQGAQGCVIAPVFSEANAVWETRSVLKFSPFSVRSSRMRRSR